MVRVVGTRYKLVGRNYDLCESDFAKLTELEQQQYEEVKIKRSPQDGKWRTLGPLERKLVQLYASNQTGTCINSTCSSRIVVSIAFSHNYCSSFEASAGCGARLRQLRCRWPKDSLAGDTNRNNKLFAPF